MSQKRRLSLSHTAAMAMQAPLDISTQIDEARTAARADAAQAHVAELIAASKQAEATRQSFKQLAAPPSAQKRVDGLRKKGRLGDIPGWMAGGKRKGREAKPPQRIEATSNDPTPERQAKAAYGWAVQAEVGGQVRHRAREFVEQYSDHLADLTDAERSAAGLLIAGFESAERAQRMTSDRAYTGKPFLGGGTDRSHLEHLKECELAEYLDRAALFEEAYQEITRNTGRWWLILRHVILREPPNLVDKPMGPYEIGTKLTAYRAKETATASGVTATKLALIRWLEALQTAMARRGQRQRRRAEMQADMASRLNEQKRLTNGSGR